PPQTRADSVRDGEHELDRKLADAPEELAKVPTGKELHHDVIVARRGIDARVEDRNDVARLDRARSPRFALEAPKRVRRPGASKGLGQDQFQRNPAMRQEVTRLVDGTHAALAERANNLVLAVDDSRLHARAPGIARVERSSRGNQW